MQPTSRTLSPATPHTNHNQHCPRTPKSQSPGSDTDMARCMEGGTPPLPARQSRPAVW
jgi:hypothetical protein